MTKCVDCLNAAQDLHKNLGLDIPFQGKVLQPRILPIYRAFHRRHENVETVAYERFVASGRLSFHEC